jgi:HEAT repeat protein
MRNRIALSVPVAAFIGIVAWQVMLHREPVYQGKSLTFWLAEGRRHNWVDPMAETAVKTMGGRAVPVLLDMAQIKDSPLRRKLIVLASKQDWLDLHIRPHEEILEMTDYGFRLLGPTAKPAVPKLVRLLHNDAPETRCLAAHCLGDIGRDAKEAVSALMKYLTVESRCRTNSDWDEKGIFCSIYALGRIGQAARPAVPQLTLFTNDPNWTIRWDAQAALIQISGNGLDPVIEALKDTSNPTNWLGSCVVVEFLGSEGSNAIPALLKAADQSDWHVQEKAIEALGKVHTQPEVCIPRITPFLKATNDWVRLHSLEAISAFGTNAHGLVATSDIIRCLGDSSELVRQQAANVLIYLEPGAAVKAGLSLEP